MTARLVAEYRPDVPRVAWAMGNLQQLPDGGAFVGWGTAGAFTEFAPDGTVRFDASLADGSVTYRAFRFPWVGRPAEPPKRGAHARGGRSDDGARELERRHRGGAVARGRRARGASALRPVAAVRRAGFESAVPLGARRGFVSLVALDAAGRELGRPRCTASERVHLGSPREHLRPFLSLRRGACATR